MHKVCIYPAFLAKRNIAPPFHSITNSIYPLFVKNCQHYHFHAAKYQEIKSLNNSRKQAYGTILSTYQQKLILYAQPSNMTNDSYLNYFNNNVSKTLQTDHKTTNHMKLNHLNR